MLIRGVKRVHRNIKMNKLVDKIDECENAIKFPGRDYFPFGIMDFCNYDPDSVREVLTGIKEHREDLLKELKRRDYRLYSKLYNDEHIREKEIDKAIDECCQSAQNAKDVFAQMNSANEGKTEDGSDDDQILDDYDNKNNYKKVKIGNAKKDSNIVYSVELDGSKDVTLSLLQLLAELHFGALKETGEFMLMDIEDKAYRIKKHASLLRNPMRKNRG